MPYERYALGTRIRATARIPYGSYALIEAGEKGTVTCIIPEAEGIEITWEKHHCGLTLWDNATLLVAGELWIEPNTDTEQPHPVTITIDIWTGQKRE